MPYESPLAGLLNTFRKLPSSSTSSISSIGMRYAVVSAKPSASNTWPSKLTTPA